MPKHGGSAGGSGDSLPPTILTFATAASLVATTLSVYSIVLQLKNYRKPLLQRWVVRIILMVPIFSLASLIALYSLDAADLIDLIRDLYEAFSIYCFFSLLLTYLGGERSLLILLHGREPTPHPWPVCLFLSPLDISDPFSFLFLKRGILQYVQIKPVLAVITIALKATGSYGEGQLQADAGYTYVSTVYNISVTLSLYCLAMFWVCTSHDLKPFRPMPKFICVKALIFFTFWQGLGVSVLVRAGIVKSALPSENFSIAIQDAMLCFEMPIFAMLHMYAFSHKDYLPSSNRTYSGRLPFMYAVKDSLLGFKDVLDDSLTTFRGTGFSYRTFEPAEGGLHSATGDARAKRARAGLRYANGGQSKYWLPMPGADAEEAYGRRPSKVAFAPLPTGYTATDAADRLIEIAGHPSDLTSSGTGFAELLSSPVRTIGRKIREKRDEERGYAPIAPEQAEEVVHNDPRFYSAAQSSNLAFMRNTAAGAVPFAGFAASSRSSIISGSSQENTLEFNDISADDDVDYDEARLLEYGDYNYPVVDASREEARRSLREMEDAFVHGRATHWRVSRAADQKKWEADATLNRRASNTPSLQRATSSQKPTAPPVDKGKGKALPEGCIDILVEDEEAEEALDQQERATMDAAFRTGIPRKAFKRTYGTADQQAISSQASTSRAAPHANNKASSSGKLPRVQQRSVSRGGGSTSALEEADAGPRYSQLNGTTMSYPAGEFEDKEHGEYAKAVEPPKHAVLTHLDDGRPFDADVEHANEHRARGQRVVSGEEQFNPWM